MGLTLNSPNGVRPLTEAEKAAVRKDLDVVGYVNGALVSGAGNMLGQMSLRSSLLVGDSITAYAETVLSTTAVTNLGNGTANIQRTSHSLVPGQKTRIAAASDPALNVLQATVISVTDANNVVVSLDGPVHNVTGSAAAMSYVDRSSTRGWATWLEAYAGEPLRRTMAAVPGARIRDIAALLPLMAAGAEDIAYICLGMNNIYSDGATLATMQSEWADLIAQVKRRSARIVVLSVPPRNSADGAWSAGKQSVHTAWNRWLYDQCALNGWEFVDTWSATSGGATYVNGAATNPDPLASMVFDNTHPSMRGAAAIGAAVWAKVSKWFGVQGWQAAHPAAIGADAGNLLTGADFATDTAGVATGWSRTGVTANMNAVFTCASRTVANDGDAAGRNQLLTLNYGTATGTASCRFERASLHSLLVAGGAYVYSQPFSITGATGLVGLELTLLGTAAGNTFFVQGHVQDSNDDALVGDFTGRLITPVFLCPASLASLTSTVRPYITSAQSGDVVVKLSKPMLRRVG